MTGFLRRLAARAPAPVFPVRGWGARDAVGALSLRGDVDVAASPRHASVLLLAGELPPGLVAPAMLAHDAMPHPRSTIWWQRGTSSWDARSSFPSAVVVEGDDVAAAIEETHREAVAGRRPSDPPLLPDVEPAPWRGVGPYGQGGAGMTGGVPYGRPLAERAEDRDGLTLDALSIRAGPLLPPFPRGLTLDLTLQGDVIQEVVLEPNPFAEGGRRREVSDDPFIRALHEPVRIASLEVARARAHLRWLADALTAHGLPALGRRVLVLAARLPAGGSDEVRRLAGTVGRTGVLSWTTRGVGAVPARDLAGRGAGPVARAAGLLEDTRAEDPAYRELGFEVIVHTDGDASSRWRQRLAEAAQALDLAARAGDRRTGAGPIESPRGSLGPGSAPTERLLPLIPALLEGLEWGDAVTALVSLDLDLEEAGAARQLLPAGGSMA